MRRGPPLYIYTVISCLPPLSLPPCWCNRIIIGLICSSNSFCFASTGRKEKVKKLTAFFSLWLLPLISANPLQIRGFRRTLLQTKVAITKMITCICEGIAEVRAVLKDFGLMCEEQRGRKHPENRMPEKRSPFSMVPDHCYPQIFAILLRRKETISTTFASTSRSSHRRFLPVY